MYISGWCAPHYAKGWPINKAFKLEQLQWSEVQLSERPFDIMGAQLKHPLKPHKHQSTMVSRGLRGSPLYRESLVSRRMADVNFLRLARFQTRRMLLLTHRNLWKSFDQKKIKKTQIIYRNISKTFNQKNKIIEIFQRLSTKKQTQTIYQNISKSFNQKKRK